MFKNFFKKILLIVSLQINFLYFLGASGEQAPVKPLTLPKTITPSNTSSESRVPLFLTPTSKQQIQKTSEVKLSKATIPGQKDVTKGVSILTKLKARLGEKIGGFKESRQLVAQKKIVETQEASKKFSELFKGNNALTLRKQIESGAKKADIIKNAQKMSGRSLNPEEIKTLKMYIERRKAKQDIKTLTGKEWTESEPKVKGFEQEKLLKEFKEKVSEYYTKLEEGKKQRKQEEKKLAEELLNVSREKNIKSSKSIEVKKEGAVTQENEESFMKEVSERIKAVSPTQEQLEKGQKERKQQEKELESSIQSEIVKKRIAE